MNWDLATDIILYASFAMLAVFVIMGLVQLVQRKSLKKVDNTLLAMFVPLILMVIVYIIFDKFLILNTRPDGSGEPSFPSTHAMVVATIFALTAIALPKYLEQKATIITIDIIMAILLVFVAIGRVLADKHWPSDVLAGIGFAAIFVFIYYLIIRNKHGKHLHENHQ